MVRIMMLMEKMKYESFYEGRTGVVQEKRQVEINEGSWRKPLFVDVEKQPAQLKRK